MGVRAKGAAAPESGKSYIFRAYASSQKWKNIFYFFLYLLYEKNGFLSVQRYEVHDRNPFLPIIGWVESGKAILHENLLSTM